jgi:endonuclease G
VLSYNSKTHTATGFHSSSINLELGQQIAKTTSAPTMPSPLLGTKCDPTIIREAATTGDTLHENADRTRNEADNSATFLMSNMMPQVPELNRGVWGDLEEYCRELVQRRAKNFISLRGRWGGKAASVGKKKLQYPQRIGKLSWYWIDKDWECRELTQTLKRDRRDDA